MDPLFLTIDEIVAIHDDQVNRYGGSHGLRDEGLLLSAAAMPEMGFGGEYLHHDLFEMAAAYLFHIVMDHPFVDGNKRAGTAAARVFLRLNGWDVPMSEDDIYELVIAVVESRAGKSQVADTFRAASAPLP